MSQSQSKLRTRRSKETEIDDFRLWLAGLEMNKPILHVNGPNYSTALMTVDFGVPSEEFRLTSDQAAELVARLRNAARQLCKDKDANVRIQTDPPNGIWWASL